MKQVEMRLRGHFVRQLGFTLSLVPGCVLGAIAYKETGWSCGAGRMTQWVRELAVQA